MEFATALLSASVEPLIERLISRELDKFARRENIHADIKDWEKMLAEINPLLDDAEDKQSDDAVKKWLDDFRDLTYDIEDVLDEFNTEALKRKVMQDSQAITNKLRKFIPTCFTSFAFKNKMIFRIEEITERLQRINGRQEKTLNLRRIAIGSRSNQLKEIRLTTSLADESRICGRDVDKEAILQLLKNEEGGNNSISVIPILGMGGIGKTTLAQLVYNDSAVKGFFDVRAWVCVSENFDVTILTRTILRQVAPQIPDLKDLDLNSLQVTLKEKLSQKKFLLVLDDVWEEDYIQWNLLRRPFDSASSNSKIVVTTRKYNAAPITAGASPYRVKVLPDDECLSILARHALDAQSFDDAHSGLKETGRKLAKRCGGLPLAAIVLGGLLRNKRSLEEWQSVLRNSPETSKTSIHPILKLSYSDLPSHLKRCFVYCAIIPKDYEFDRDELVSLWMAEGFLDHPQGGMLMEDLGIEYFEELVSRSFFQSSNSDQSAVPFHLPGISSFCPTIGCTRSVFVMHDLISDLAQTIAKDICYNYENKSEGDMSSSKYEKVRHASFCLSKDSQEYEVFSPMKNLRTIVGFPILRKYDMIEWHADLHQELCYEFSPQSRCIRVLSITVWGLPKSIGDWKHLRHLNLSFSTIQQLPESVSSLLNLHTLLLHDCFSLKKLPDKTRNLVNLRHLDIANTHQLKKIPSGIGKLTNLQTLSKFIVDKGHGTTIAELKNLKNLRGSLSIEGLKNVPDGKSANLKEKQGLEKLVLQWTGLHHERNDMSVLESLEPHQNLKRLSIWSYGGAEFPSWVCNMSQLVSLSLWVCDALERFPIIYTGNGEQSLLEELKIVHCDSLQYFETNFRLPTSLRKLTIQYCGNLLSLPDGLMMPDDDENQPQSCLEHLMIQDCQRLTSLPTGKFPAALKTLEIGGFSLELESAISKKNTELESITITDNDSIEALPSIDCLQSLKSLSINNCQNLSLLPIRIQSHFPSLRELGISNCPKMSSLMEADGGPGSITTLKMQDCENLRQPIAEWGLGMLSSLVWLEVSGRCPATAGVVSFPDDNCCWLPTSLEVLDMANFQNLESVSMGLEKLTSLRFVGFRDCPKLRSLPREALPPSLQRLTISGCPLLKEHYTSGKIGLLNIDYQD